MCDSIEPGLNCLSFNKRAQDPGTQQACAHARHGGVECGDQRSGAARTTCFFREDRGKQLQITDGNGIEHQCIVLFVIADAVEMAQRFNARSIHVFICRANTIPARGVFP